MHMDLKPIPANYTTPDHTQETRAYPSEQYYPRSSKRNSSLSQQTIMPQTILTELKSIPANYATPDPPHGTPAYPRKLNCPKPSTRISSLS
ncbi:hypothetical protein DPMN_013870 [Dreissena polymorpha]|uniref:Uncharacterized protein n=2 Tax=Dreissena polymorpha TaxID=45954 RepID=A0A9D4N856_DREPO|nr:hypothetical protein DPMN_013870 [Dreissena polymorpha]